MRPFQDATEILMQGQREEFSYQDFSSIKFFSSPILNFGIFGEGRKFFHYADIGLDRLHKAIPALQ